MQNKVYIRADGGANIGLGHLVRCIALAQMLKTYFSITFFCKEIPSNIIEQLNGERFSLVKIADENEFLDRLNGSEIVVLDHYDLDSDYQQIIKSKGCKLVSIDDLHDKFFSADLIINHAPGIKASDYKTLPSTQFALGLDYVLLRQEFLNGATATTHPSNKIETAFVCFGGADTKNLTQTVVDEIKDDNRFKKIIVVTGASYKYAERLNHSTKHDERFSVYENISAGEMFDLMLTAQLAIVPASGILQEIISLKIKAISGMYTDNQKYLFDDYKQINAFESAENFEPHNLRLAINRCFENQAPSPTQNLIDGKSGERILGYFKQLFLEDEINLRKANETDADITYKWASDADIRRFSFNNSTISLDEHLNWFKRKISAEACYYYIALMHYTPVGSVRFDVTQDHACISYLIDTQYHGKGLGTILLKKGLNHFSQNAPRHFEYVYGDVLLSNKASIKIFRKLGYTEEVDLDKNLIRFKKYIHG